MLLLELFGALALRAEDDGSIPRAACQRRRLGLIAMIALGGKRGVSRYRVEAYLWPESDAAKARHALDQTIYVVRRLLGAEVILTAGQELILNPELVAVDVWDFDAAIRAEDWARAIALHKGALLERHEFGASRDLETWIDEERSRRRQQYRTAVELLGDRSAAAGDASQHVAWRRQLVRSDPLSAASTSKLIHALAAAGDRAGAVKHAREYQDLVRRELDVEPELEIERLASLLSRPSPAEVFAAPVSPAGVESAAEPVIASAVVADGPAEKAGTSTPARSGQKGSHQSFSRVAIAASSAVIVLLLLGVLALRIGLPNGILAGMSERISNRSKAPSTIARADYLRGLNAWEDRTKEGNDKAVVFFREATQADPEYAEAFAGLAEAYVRIGYFGYRPAEGMFPKARAAALRSIQLDSTLATPHTALATELMWEHRFDESEVEYRRAISLDGRNATAHQWHGVMLMIVGRSREAVEEERQASVLEPLNLQIQNNYATFLYVVGDSVAALHHFRETVGEEPDSAWVARNPWVLANMSRVYADDGEFGSAARMIDRALTIVPASPRALHTRAVIYDEMGRPDLARQAFARADTANEQYSAYRGMLYGDQGNADSAFVWFAREDKWGIQPMLSLQADRRLVRIRADPRYRMLMKRLGISN